MTWVDDHLAKEPPGEWAKHAACAGMPIDVFFAQRGSNGEMRQALAICKTCIVRPACLQYALTSPRETTGCWGGLTPSQRRNMNPRPERRMSA